MFAVFKREVKAYMQSAIGFVFMGIFLICSGVFFTMYNLMYASADLGTMLSSMEFLFAIVIPILTMKLFSDERRLKTDQLLLTSPVSIWSVVMGKILAACTVFFITLAVTFVYVIMLDIFGTPAYGEVFAGYLGFFLLGCALISLGAFMSSLTESQVNSCILSLGAILILLYGGQIFNYIDVDFLYYGFRVIDIFDRYAYFTQGIISPAYIIYMLTFFGMFAFLTVRVIEKRRWSEG